LIFFFFFFFLDSDMKFINLKLINSHVFLRYKNYRSIRLKNNNFMLPNLII
jgi:hypothetical protein